MRRSLGVFIVLLLAGTGCGGCGQTAPGSAAATSGGSGGSSGSNGASGSSGTSASCSGAAPLCANQHGVCAGSHAHCVAGAWAACTAQDFGPGYSPSEQICDGVDHNCDGVVSGTVSCSGFCCGADQACAGAACQQVGAICGADADCQGDSRCLAGACVPWTDGGFDSQCVHPAQPPHFSPSIRCAWPPAEPDGGYLVAQDPLHRQVITTPLVADFKLFPGAHPMVVFPTQNSLGGGTPECVGDATSYGLIRILDPQTCSISATLDGADQHVIGSSTPAIGDLDGDGRPEIVAAAVGGGLVALTYDGAQWKTLWHSTNADGTPSTLNAGKCSYAGPSIADVNGDGLPEIVYGAVIHDHTGKVMGSSLGMQGYSSGQIPVLADVDLDGGPELVTGNGLFTFSASAQDFVPVPGFLGTGLTNGFTAVARFGSFPAPGEVDPGYPQIAVVGGGKVRIQTIDGRVVFGPYSVPASSGGGPPTIGDFNGDGQPDLAAAASDSFTVFSFHCVVDGGALPADCAAPGILWTHPSQDHSSNVTGSSLFDFTGAGTVDGVYADECFARVYDGRSGDVIYSQWHSSCTWYENPVVADVLANYSSQIIVGSNQNCGTGCTGSTDLDAQGRAVDKFFNGLHCETAADCPSASDTCVGGLCRCTGDDGCCGTPGHCQAEGFVCAAPPAAGDPASGDTCRAVYNGAYPGLRIYADAQNRWADSRSIWNQHAYAVSNVNDDGTIPSAAQARHNWLVPGLNDFRENVQGQLSPLAAAHLTVSFTDSSCTQGDGTLVAQVCNRGSSGVVSGAPVIFSAGGTQLCALATQGSLAPGGCESLTCLWSDMPAGAQTVMAVVDPQGTTRPCEGDGNVATLQGLFCHQIGR